MALSTLRTRTNRFAPPPEIEAILPKSVGQLVAASGTALGHYYHIGGYKSNPKAWDQELQTMIVDLGGANTGTKKFTKELEGHAYHTGYTTFPALHEVMGGFFHNLCPAVGHGGSSCYHGDACKRVHLVSAFTTNGVAIFSFNADAMENHTRINPRGEERTQLKLTKEAMGALANLVMRINAEQAVPVVPVPATKGYQVPQQWKSVKPETSYATVAKSPSPRRTKVHAVPETPSITFGLSVDERRRAALKAFDDQCKKELGGKIALAQTRVQMHQAKLHDAVKELEELEDQYRQLEESIASSSAPSSAAEDDTAEVSCPEEEIAC